MLEKLMYLGREKAVPERKATVPGRELDVQCSGNRKYLGGKRKEKLPRMPCAPSWNWKERQERSANSMALMNIPCLPNYTKIKNILTF
jgi:hypothetical protein